MNKIILAGVSFFFTLMLAKVATAAPLNHNIRIIGRDSAHVTTAQVRLGDLANISSKDMTDDDALIALQKIVIADAPAPGEKLTLSAQDILEKLRLNGVDLQQVGYALKRVMVVERASRVLAAAEIRSAIEEYLKNYKDEVVLKDIQYRENIKVAPGITELKVATASNQKIGQMVFNIEADVVGAEPVKFSVKGSVDEWREVPVAAHPLKRGSVIGDDDIVMARLNVQSLPDDVAVNSDNLIGLSADKGISVGEVFRLNKLSLPPVIEKGSAVTIIYKKGSLTATATGVALADAGAGENIKVRNTSSKKIITGSVIEAGLVGVNQ